jgi:glucose-1-phosphate cytidylyltransferase
MEIYAAQGFDDFLLASGFNVEAIEDFASGLPSDWTVQVIDTGLETNTGGRVLRCRDLLGDSFFLTYGDGVGNIDLAELIRFHSANPGSTTVTVVPLPSPYGTLDARPDGRVDRFVEKPRLDDHWINAGFFVMDRSAFDDWAGEDLERDVLPALAIQGQLYMYRHRGFWRSMDTYKDALALSSLLEDAEHTGEPVPWLDLPTRASS